MSRAKATDVSSPISLFPFIGVLLSTMGALLVVLICVSRSARDSAVREIAAQQAAADDEKQQESRQEFEKVERYLAQLNEVRAEAEKRLRDDQLRLGHIEDHIRRMRERVESLQNAAMELVSLEDEHYDDRQQAEREVERLGQLIEATRNSIASLQDESKHKKRSYAIIPYEGPHGTRRRPIYIECRKDEVLLQPEGIVLTPADFRPPLGAGNPLAAALRAAREYIVTQEGGPAKGADMEPYPLILVRPEGILAYYHVRDAIESWDAAFGYELVDDDWTLEFPPPNPLLADLEHQAVAQSRSRQQMLVAAAPRAYGPSGENADDEFGDGELTGGGGFGDDGDGGGHYGGDSDSNSDGRGYHGGSGGGVGGPYAVDADANGVTGEFVGNGMSQAGGNGVAGDQSQRPGHGSANGNGLVGEPGTGTGGSGENGMEFVAGGNSAAGPIGRGGSRAGSGSVPQTQQPGTSTNIVAGTAAEGEGGQRGPVAPLSSNTTGASLANGIGEANLMAADRAGQHTGSGAIRAPGGASGSNSGTSSERVPLDMQMNVQQRVPVSARGQNWAIRGKTPSSVPIRRSIHVVVRSDRISIQPDSAQAPGNAAVGKEIPLDGPTVAQLDDFVAAVQDRVHEWGLAGTGMYWRPVLLLDTSPDGRRRADDLIRLLRTSGIEIRDERAAARTSEREPSATR